MTKARKVLTVFGTRPEAIKLFPLIHALVGGGQFIARVCLTGQHRDMVASVLALAGVRPDHDLDLMVPGQSLDQLTATLLPAIGQVLDLEQPDWLVVQGDTTSAMAGALAGYYRKIPVVHVEAGLRSGDNHHPWPEEVNRKVIGTIAALHCAPTETAAQALLAENIDPAYVHVTGNTGIDALHWTLRKAELFPELAAGLRNFEKLYAGKRIIGVTAHRRENIGASMEQIAKAVRQLARRDDVAVIFPVHPNPEVSGVMRRHLAGIDNITLIQPLDYPHFARLLGICHFMLTDSGGVQEEAPALGKPVLVMRDTTERPEGIIAGTAKLVGADADRIVAEATRLLDDDAAYRAMARAYNPYGDGKASDRIVNLLAGCAAV